MFNKKNTITICADAKYAIDIKEITNQIKTYGVIENYLKGDVIYVSFTTKISQKELAKLLKKKLYKTEAEIHGAVIFLKEKA